MLLWKGFEPKDRKQESLADHIDGKTAILLVNNLPEKYKKIMRMRYVQDLSLKEIQTITKQSKNSIAVQAHRGLEKLRNLYNYEPAA